MQKKNHWELGVWVKGGGYIKCNIYYHIFHGIRHSFNITSERLISLGSWDAKDIQTNHRMDIDYRNTDYHRMDIDYRYTD